MLLWGHRFSQNPNQTLQRFLPSNKLPGQKSLEFLVGILGETMTSWIHSEFNWPLEGRFSSNCSAQFLIFLCYFIYKNTLCRSMYRNLEFKCDFKIYFLQVLFMILSAMSTPKVFNLCEHVSEKYPKRRFLVIIFLVLKKKLKKLKLG